MLTKIIYQSTERINIESIIKLVLQIFEISKSIILLRQKCFSYGVNVVRVLESFDSTMAGHFIKKMKTSFDFNFDLYKAFKQRGYTLTSKQREAVG